MCCKSPGAAGKNRQFWLRVALPVTRGSATIFLGAKVAIPLTNGSATIRLFAHPESSVTKVALPYTRGSDTSSSNVKVAIPYGIGSATSFCGLLDCSPHALAFFQPPLVTWDFLLSTSTTHGALEKRDTWSWDCSVPRGTPRNALKCFISSVCLRDLQNSTTRNSNILGAKTRVRANKIR